VSGTRAIVRTSPGSLPRIKPKRNPTMSKKATRLHRATYETAGAMIRAGLWTIEYAAFHFSTVTASLHA